MGFQISADLLRGDPQDHLLGEALGAAADQRKRKLLQAKLRGEGERVSVAASELFFFKGLACPKWRRGMDHIAAG